MSDFDAEAMFGEIVAGAERGKRIAAARPTWPQLSDGLWAYHDAAQAAFYPGETRTSIVAHRESLIDPGGDSPAVVDAEALVERELNSGNELLLRIAHMYVGGIVNHFGGLAALVQNDVSARPAIALARVVLDASVHCCHLLKPNLTAVERTVRAVNIQVDMLRAERNDLDQAPPVDQELRVDEFDRINGEVSELHRDAESDGFARFVSKKGVAQDYLHPGPVSVEQLLTQYGDGDLYRTEWRHGSSVVHVKERPIIEFLIGSGDTKQEVHGRAYAAGKLMPAILMATEALSYASEYLGADDTALDTLRNQLLNYWAFGTGMRDEEIARQLGIGR